MTTTVNLSFAALTIDSADPTALADFWAKALGRPVSPGAVAGDTAVDATGPDSGPRMILHHPPGPGTAKNSVHPVLVTDHHDQEIERLARPGARPGQRDQAPACGAATWRGGGPPDHVRRPGGQRVRSGHLAARVVARPAINRGPIDDLGPAATPGGGPPVQDHQDWPKEAAVNYR